MVALGNMVLGILASTAAAAPRLRAVRSPSPVSSTPATSATPPSTGSPTPSSPAQGPYVNLRVLGNNNTKIFQGLFNRVSSATITTSSGGSYQCGTSSGAPLDALAVAAKRKGFSYDATWDGSSFNVTSISDLANNGDAAWELFVNHDWSGGQASCQSLGGSEAEVWWVYNPSQYEHFLHLLPVKGNSEGQGEPFQVTVVDYLTGKPVQGATVAGVTLKSGTTDANGHATVVMEDCGPYNLQANMDGSLSSNWIYLVSDPGERKRCV